MGNSSTKSTPHLSTLTAHVSVPSPELAKKTSIFSLRRFKSTNVSTSFDSEDIYTEPDYSNFTNDFTPRISARGIRYGLLRIKLGGMDQYIKRVMGYMQFHLKYKIISNDNKCCMSNKNQSEVDHWDEVHFNSLYVRNAPETHFCLRLRSCLCSYTIKLQLTMRSRKTLSQRRIDAILLAKNIWCPWSEVITVEVPSLMKQSNEFKVGDWIKFNYTPNIPSHVKSSKKWKYGTITEISQEWGYKISHHRSKIDYLKRECIKYFPAVNYVDISGRLDADIMLLFGDRMGVDSANIEDIYSALYECFYKQYACQIFKRPRLNNILLVSMATCVAFNVIDFLCMDKEKVYKIRCCINERDQAHYDNTLQLIPTRSYQINKCRELKRWDSLDSWFYCDICLCRKGIYGWMFRCQFEKHNANNGHDSCLTCIHDMVEAHNQLTQLLEEILNNKLSNDCIQIISCYAIGNVIKHKHC